LILDKESDDGALPFPLIEAGASEGPLDWFLYSGVYFYALSWLAVVLYREACAGDGGLVSRKPTLELWGYSDRLKAVDSAATEVA
jgi:hypothetical protein